MSLLTLISCANFSTQVSTLSLPLPSHLYSQLASPSYFFWSHLTKFSLPVLEMTPFSSALLMSCLKCMWGQITASVTWRAVSGQRTIGSVDSFLRYLTLLVTPTPCPAPAWKTNVTFSHSTSKPEPVTSIHEGTGFLSNSGSIPHTFVIWNYHLSTSSH